MARYIDVCDPHFILFKIRQPTEGFYVCGLTVCVLEFYFHLVNIGTLADRVVQSAAERRFLSNLPAMLAIFG